MRPSKVLGMPEHEFTLTPANSDVIEELIELLARDLLNIAEKWEHLVADSKTSVHTIAFIFNCFYLYVFFWKYVFDSLI